MTKRVAKKELLLSAGEDGYAFYVERSSAGKRYFQKRYNQRRYELLDTVEMELIVLEELEQYPAVKEHGFELMVEDAEVDLERIKKLAPELLPQSFRPMHSDGEDNDWNIPTTCPDGYEYKDGACARSVVSK